MIISVTINILLFGFHPSALAKGLLGDKVKLMEMGGIGPSKTLNTCKTSMKSMTEEKLEDIVRVSPKGQIVIPKEIRKRLGVSAGERLLVMSRDKEILIKKMERLSIEEIGEKVDKVTKEKGIDVDKLIDGAIEWARKSR